MITNYVERNSTHRTIFLVSYFYFYLLFNIKEKIICKHKVCLKEKIKLAFQTNRL